jgi:hypothetical protein
MLKPILEFVDVHVTIVIQPKLVTIVTHVTIVIQHRIQTFLRCVQDEALRSVLALGKRDTEWAVENMEALGTAFGLHIDMSPNERNSVAPR